MYRIKCSKCYLNSVIVNELHNISTKYARHQETDWFENRTVWPLIVPGRSSGLTRSFRHPVPVKIPMSLAVRQ
jgi:hypothetical protein